MRSALLLAAFPVAAAAAAMRLLRSSTILASTAPVSIAGETDAAGTSTTTAPATVHWRRTTASFRQWTAASAVAALSKNLLTTRGEATTGLTAEMENALTLVALTPTVMAVTGMTTTLTAAVSTIALTGLQIPLAASAAAARPRKPSSRSTLTTPPVPAMMTLLTVIRTETVAAGMMTTHLLADNMIAARTLPTMLAACAAEVSLAKFARTALGPLIPTVTAAAGMPTTTMAADNMTRPLSLLPSTAVHLAAESGARNVKLSKACYF